MRRKKHVARMQAAFVLISWTAAWGWSKWTAPAPLPEPDWRVSALVKFLEAMPPVRSEATRNTGERQAASREGKSRQRAPRVSLELNTADSAALEALPFIGPTLAGRVIRFRDALGGFVEVGQLQEVYGLDSLAYAVVSQRVHVDSQAITTLCADTASWSALRRHPYIGVAGARAIERYRAAHALHSVDDLAAHPPIGDSLVQRWRPYLRVCGWAE